ELVAQILFGIAIVVDVDLVQNGVVEGRKVRAARRRLERDVVGDNRDRVRSIRADERIDVRVVGGRVLADEGGLTVAGRARRGARVAGARPGGAPARPRTPPHRAKPTGFSPRLPPPSRFRISTDDIASWMCEAVIKRPVWLYLDSVALAADTFTANTNRCPSRLMLPRLPPSGPRSLNTSFGAPAP